MLMSEKVLSLSPSSSSPSSNTSIPPPSSKPNSQLSSTSPSARSQNSFAGYSSPSSRDKFSPTSTSSSFFSSSSSPGHQSSNSLNSWNSKPLGSHNFRNTTSHVNSRSNSTLSGSNSFDTPLSNNKPLSATTESTSFDNISKSSKRKREEWTHVNSNDDQSSHHHYGVGNSVRRYIKINSRQAKRLMREQKNKRCVVKIGQKIETQLPESELMNLRDNRCVNLVNVIEADEASPLSRKLSAFLSTNTSSSGTTSYKCNNNDNTNTSYTSSQPTRQISSSNIDSKRAIEATKHINVGGGGSSSISYIDSLNHNNGRSDDSHANSRKAKPNRYIGPKSRTGHLLPESRENRGENKNLNREMTAEDQYDALISRTTTSVTKPKSRDGVPSNGQRSLSSSSLAKQYSPIHPNRKLENGKDALPSRYSGGESSEHSDISYSNYGPKERGQREFDSFCEKYSDTKDRGYHKSKAPEGKISAESSSNTRESDTYDKITSQKLNPIKLSQLPSWRKQSSNQLTSHPNSERKSLERSIEKLKFPSSRDSSSDNVASKSNSCSTRPENPPLSLSSSSSSISSSHLASPALAAAAAIAAPREIPSLSKSTMSSYTTSFHTSKSTIRPSSTFSETKLLSSISPSSPKSSSPISTDAIKHSSSDSNAGNCEQQPSIVAAYSLKSFEEAPEGENLRDDNGWSLQPISPNRNTSIDDQSSKMSLHKRFFPQKYTSEHTHRESMETESTNDSKQHMGDKSESKYNGKCNFHLAFYIIMSIFE